MNNIQQVPISDLIPYARNSRTHSDEQVAQIAGSIREFGFTNPVLIDASGTIIAGHGRVLAARKLSMPSVPCLRLGHLTPAQVRAYVIADNRMALSAGWDEEMLRAEIAGLQADGFDIGQIGFTDEEIAALLTPPASDDKADPDDVPVYQDKAVSALGDVWKLGAHRLICGDCTKPDVMARASNGRKLDACVTDPPYGLGDTSSEKNNYDTYQDTKNNLHLLVSEFMPSALSACQVVIVTPGNTNQRIYPAPAWVMAWFTPAGSGLGPWGFCCWQPILCYGKDPKLSAGKGSHPDALVHTEAAEKNGHPCPKPIKFWSWLVERVTEPGQVLWEPFSGSGTTIIACEKTGRICCASELSPNYVDVAVKRWQALTGKQATLESTGETFDTIAAKRAK